MTDMGQPQEDKGDVAAWRALADPTRRRILDLLRDGPKTTGALTEHFPRSRFAIMKHLELLTEAQLVLVERRGRERWNHLNAAPLYRLYTRWLNRYQRFWAQAIGTLRETVAHEGAKPVREEHAMSTREALAVGSFHVEQETELGAPPSRVFEALTTHVAAWWGPPHVSSEATNQVTMEPHVGGRFFESWPGGGRLWATVTWWEPGRRLELRGPMGMRGPVVGAVRFTLEAAGGGTRLRLTHRAFGDLDEATASSYRSGWEALLERRLRAFVESGERLGVDRRGG